MLLRILLFLLVPVALSMAAGFGPYRATVGRVIDGDTIVMSLAIYPGQVATTRIRLRSVDTPELNSSLACERDLAAKATAFTRDFLAGGVAEVSAVDFDLYGGRMDATVSVGGRDLAAALLAAGLARPASTKGPWCV